MTIDKLELLWEEKKIAVRKSFSEMKKDKRYQEQLESLR